MSSARTTRGRDDPSLEGNLRVRCRLRCPAQPGLVPQPDDNFTVRVWPVIAGFVSAVVFRLTRRRRAHRAD
jgi:hypothetical protein